ncbi:cysteine desulfurase [Candidatus Wolfebacteria bacterium]|nr:cysteine desulfurase [Candidatus Wolfebacteria bacterium]
MNRIYLDYAATTPVDPVVGKAMESYFSEKFGNPNSLHFFGQQARAGIDLAREKIAKLIGADFGEIIFTGSATEANNLALRGLVKFLNNFEAIGFRNQNIFSPAEKISFPSSRRLRPQSEAKPVGTAGYSSNQYASFKKISPLRIIVSAVEHESVLETARDLEREGIEIIYLAVDKNGVVDLKKLKNYLNSRTILVSIMYANNEIGIIQSIKKISKIISEFKGDNIYPLFHTDAVQAFQFLNCNVDDLGVDLMTLSAHKIYGPKGIGALYARQIANSKGQTVNKLSAISHLPLAPIVTGGEQEFGLRSGTENTAAIVGFAKAVELAEKNRDKETKRILALKNYFWKKLKKIYPKAQINGIINYESKIMNTLPNIINVHFPNFKAEDLVIKLDLNGIAVSSGSACASFSAKPSHVLEALGYKTDRIKSSLRFSFGKFTGKSEVNTALKIIKKVLK